MCGGGSGEWWVGGCDTEKLRREVKVRDRWERIDVCVYLCVSVYRCVRACASVSASAAASVGVGVGVGTAAALVVVVVVFVLKTLRDGCGGEYGSGCG